MSPTRFSFPKTHSIRARMTLAFTLYIAFLIALLGLAFFLYLEHQESKRVNAILVQASHKLRQELSDEVPGPASLMALVAEERDEMRAMDVSVIVTDSQGSMLAHSQIQSPQWPLDDHWRFQTFDYHGYSVAVAMPWQEMRTRLREPTQALLLMGGIVVLLSSVGAWLLVGRTLSPLEGLTRQASAASAENLRVQLQPPSSDAEMVGLVTTLNDLLGRLAQTAHLQGKFYAAASHELRTPLHSLNLLHEVALSRPREIGEYRDALTQSHEQIQWLIRLIQDLLLLNQLDMETSRYDPVLLDLADICEGELNLRRGEIEKKQLEIIAPLPATCELTAPWTHVTMIFHNLVENAVKYAQRGGKIEVEVTPQRLRIWNECDIDENFDMQKYFEPFFRPDAVRNSQTGGNGLGLPICHAICQANGWGFVLAFDDDGFSAVVDFKSAKLEEF